MGQTSEFNTGNKPLAPGDLVPRSLKNHRTNPQGSLEPRPEESHVGVRLPCQGQTTARSWFPNNAPRAEEVPYLFPPLLTREFKSVTNKEVLDTLKECSSDNAPGISGITYCVWKWVALVAPDQLISVVRASIKLQVHHPSWKQALVAVIPKNNKKDMALPKSHHPIQLIECLCKLVKKIVAQWITYNLGQYKLMPFNQFGSRSNSSCLDTAMALTHDIHSAREKNLVSSFLAVDIKGFFDHVDHNRLISVLIHLGFPPEITDWVESFLSERFVRVQVDDCIGELHPQKVGAPQGSPVSPILACVYSSIVLVLLNHCPIFDKTGSDSIPVAPRTLVDDYRFLACSQDLETNIFTLRKTLEYAVDILLQIGMKIDPDKCNLMHFTWRRGSPALGHHKNPLLVTRLYRERIIITAPKSIRWLGFHLDCKLSFTHHVPTLTKKGVAIVNGLKVLGNTIAGIGPANLRHLCKTVVVPAITYGAPLWFNPDKPNRKLVRKLEQVQHKALLQITGGFYDLPAEALQFLTYIPPITSTLTKLFSSAATCIPRLPLSSEVTKRLPSSFLRSVLTL